jgi:hypothetical protein
MRAVVIPSCRPESLQKWLEAWKDCADWQRTYIVWDLPFPPSIEIPGGVEVIQNCWVDHHVALGDREWIVSRRDSACRSFGFYLAWRDGATHIATMDDDCFPRDLPWFGGHLAAMHGATRWFRTVEDVRPRGLPYFNLGNLDVRINHGLWCGVPDLDSVHGLAAPQSDYEASAYSRIVPHQQTWTMCGMNLAFHRNATPLMLFAPMGQGQKYRRFDDIWSGLIVARCCRALGWSIASGPPRVQHLRASNPLANLEAEAAGILMNERLWETIEAIDVNGTDAVSAVASVADGLLATGDEYLEHYGLALRAWSELFIPSTAEMACCA